MKIFLSYLHYHAKTIMLFGVFFFIFSLVFFLANIPLEAILYSVSLFLVFFILFTLFDFYKFRKRHLSLLDIQGAITVSTDSLTSPRNLIEEDYTALIEILFNEKCAKSNEKENSIKEMGDYYTLWAHQIKTPIAAMRLMLNADDSHDRELDEQLFKIEQYVDMVLQYIRVEGTSTDFVIKEISLDSAVRQSVRKYAKSFIRKKIALSYTETSETAVSDEKWLCFVIEQLLSNSLKYTRSGGEIQIYTQSNPPTLIIKDSGIGIEAEDIARIFDKGYTGYNGRSDKKSTGIGLYLCHNILDKLGHKIKIESKVGVGTTVYIYFDAQKRTE